MVVSFAPWRRREADQLPVTQRAKAVTERSATALGQVHAGQHYLHITLHITLWQWLQSLV